jgi:hypothetical protein
MPDERSTTRRGVLDVLHVVATIIGSLAVPILVVWLGWWLPEKMGEDQRTAAAQARERELAATEASTRVAKATVIPALMDGLLSPDGPKRRLSIAAMLLALPSEGPDMIRQLELTADNEQVRLDAKTALKTRQDQLVTGLLANDANLRQRAERALIEGYHADPDVAKNILDRVQSPGVSQETVASATTIMGTLSEAAVAPNRPRIEKFLSSQAAQKAKAGTTSGPRGVARPAPR